MTEMILGIDTSTQVCVGLARSGEVIAPVCVGDSRSHVELLMSTVEQVMADAGVTMSDLTGIAVGMGPGPYTGLRVGVVAGEVLALTQEIPVFHLCSLDALGIDFAQTNPDQDFIACTDARRKEVYWARYDRSGARIEGPFVSSAQELPNLTTIGPGVHGSNDGGVVVPYCRINAGLLAAHAHELSDVGPTPLYLRVADAQVSVRVKSVLPTVSTNRLGKDSA
ncbi:MAG: tRNA (adenosine(37)-N6)-threonylcarbamoyltransferase complex dimerization subunit type 1 TsaB [Propionibacteriaceae bacterium]|nr:tRNA (adenosine(37)-N6)-threonylcarbamoyltransferase complex dimerization subunit type 1 TsaB [Propionibacteriaceae bacterium]